MSTTRLSVRDLSVSFRSGKTYTHVVHQISFDIMEGENLALVGESGSGKSVTSLAVMRLLVPAPRSLITGQVMLGDTDLAALSESAMQKIRGARVAMIFQEPLTSLNPVHRIGAQVAEAIRFHTNKSKAEANARALDLLDLVGIPDPKHRMQSYPHELSGGMRQRVMIAMALALEPDVLIADEPTTALDVTVQAQILDLLHDIQQRTKMAILFITHNFGVVAEVADRVMVMYSGRIVEEGNAREVLLKPGMPYTKGLLASVPRMETAGLGDEKLGTIEGFVPDPNELPSGCTFHPRCGDMKPGICDAAMPELASFVSPNHRIRCARASEFAEQLRQGIGK